MTPAPSRLPRSGAAYQVIGGALAVLAVLVAVTALAREVPVRVVQALPLAVAGVGVWRLGERIALVSPEGGPEAEPLRGRAVLVVLGGVAASAILAFALPAG